MSNPTSEVELLKRKIEREKKARLKAEAELEVYSREIYLANKSLKENLDRTNKRKAELEFLNKTSSIVNSEISTQKLLKEIVAQMGDFVSASFATIVMSENGEVANQNESLIWTKDRHWHVNENNFSLFCDSVSYEKSVNTTQWILSPTELSDGEESPMQLVLYKSFAISKTLNAVIGFVLTDEQVEEEILFVLDTTRDHLISGLRRRMADERILRRNAQLEDTVARLESAKQQLIQSEKMASLGQLAAGIAHEINNPISFIGSNLQVLEEYHDIFRASFDSVQKILQSDNFDKQAIDRVANDNDLAFLLSDSEEIVRTNLEGVARVKDIVNELKTFSHVGEDSQVSMSLYSCIDSSLKVVSNELKYQHEVDNQLNSELPKVIGNSGQLQQVFINLFVNAAHAMPDGGKLTIRSTIEDDQLTIFVEDTGEGMTEETKSKMFSPFYTTKPVGTGTGLGLSVSMAILEAHHVEIEVESTLGKGSCFALTFQEAPHCNE